MNNYNCNQKTLYDVLEYIAQITSSVWTTRYVSDTEIAIDFYTLDKLPTGQTLIYDKDYCDENSIIDITYSFNSSNYRNKQVMTSDAISGDTLTTKEIITVGQNYILDDNIAKITSATLNGTSLSIATTNDKENGATADLYYKVGTNEFELDDEVLPGQILIISYYPQITGRQVVLNNSEITRIDNQLNNSGIIARYENRADASTSQELNSIGNSYINFKGKADVDLVVRTINNDIWNVGDIVYFDVNQTQGLEDLVDNYVVKKKTTRIIQNNADSTNYIFYEYELSNNYNFETAVNFFDNQRMKLIGNIKEGDYINRYVENYKSYNIVFSPPVINGGA